MTLFLRWALLQVLAVVGMTTLYIVYTGDIHAAGQVMIAVVLGVYALASGYCGWLCWNKVATPRQLSHVSLAITACPMLALLGSVAGFIVALSGGVEDVQERVLGASTGLAATFVGIVAALLLMVQEHSLRPERSGCCQ